MFSSLSFYIYIGYMFLLYLASVLAGLIPLKKNWRFSFKVLVVYTCANFCFAIYSTYANIARIEQWSYTIWIPVETGFLIYFLTLEARRRGIKRLFAWYWIYFPLSLVVSYRIQKFSFHYTNIYAVLFSLLATLIVACALIIDVMLRDDDVPLFRVPVCWAAIGILFYTVFFIIIMSLTVKLFDIDESQKLFLPFSYVANTFEYGGIIAAFIVYSKEYKRQIKIG